MTALVNAVVVYSLPLLFVAIVSFLRSNPNGSTTVVGIDPDRAAALNRRVQFLAGYCLFMAPFAMAAAWRTFVHAVRRMEGTGTGAQGIFEAAACGFLGAVLVLLPGILTKPLQAPPYVVVYGGLSAIVGLAVGLILWISAATTLKVITTQTRG